MVKRDSKSRQKVRRKRGRPVRQDVVIEFHRVRLFQVLGIVMVCRHALASKLVTLDEESVMEALRAASRIVSEVVEGLEGAMTGKPIGPLSDDAESSAPAES